MDPPIPLHSSPDFQNPRKTKTLDLRPQPQCGLNPRIWLFLLVLSIQITVLFITRRTISLPSESTQCPYGRVFVYHLPSVFNQDLIDACSDSDPRHWRCGAVNNDGFGPPTTELAGIVPESLTPAWYWTNQFANEMIYHHRLLTYKCRTTDPESATAFYLPFYAGLAVGKYLWENQTMRDRDGLRLVKWVQRQRFWKRTNGSDHFITLGRITWDFRRLDQPELDWGSNFINNPAMRNVTRFVIERAPRDPYDIGVPYPTGFHPRSVSDVVEWQSFVRKKNRSSLFSFVGGERTEFKNDFRGLLLSQCKNESGSCRFLDCARTDCGLHRTRILETFLDSDFCLQPRGDSYTRRSVFDCMLSGSVPVFFWFRTAYDQYKWFLPGDPDSYSVFIEPRDVKNGRSIREVLEKYSKDDVKRMREKVIEIIPKFVYAKPNEGLATIKDAFDIAVEGLMQRFNSRREQSLKIIS